MTWNEAICRGSELVVSTCSEDIPNANIVISLGAVDGKLLFADCQMNNTIKNLKQNNKVCIVAKKDGEYYRIRGTVEIFKKGKYLDICNKADSEYKTKHAILVKIEEVFDLDKGVKEEI